jgi:hypothetical protein
MLATLITEESEIGLESLRNDIQTSCATQKIEALDFTELKAKLMLHEPEGYNWSEDQANSAERAYKLFLMLHVLYPNHRNSPNIPVDLFWYAHILDTRRYATDCQEIFGHFMHHFPYLGLRGDKEKLDVAFKETNKLYRKEFGTDSAIELAVAGHAVSCSDPCSTDEG